MMKEIRQYIGFAIEMEKRNADKVYGPLRSKEECAGVLAEQIQEFYDESLCFHMSHNSSISDLFRTVRMCGYKEMVDWLKECQRNAIEAACEAVQVAAVCDRFLEYLDKEGEGHGNALASDKQ